MDIVLPCIQKVIYSSGGGGTTVDFSWKETGDGGKDVYIMITPEDSPVSIVIIPSFPYVIPVPNFSVIIDDLFGQSRIQIQKDEIQKYFTQILRYVVNNYGFPLTDNQALQFTSSGVRRQFLRRPDLAILAEAMWTDADEIVTGSFGYDKSGPGIRQRLVNQFLANAAYNEWPLQATLDLWQALVAASTCIEGRKKVTPLPPTPLPPNPPPPGEPRQCPPGYTEEDCKEICGRIRQLTAGQQPLGQRLLELLPYFRDCILPPDGSWQYFTPQALSEWTFTTLKPYPFLQGTTRIQRMPQEYWPYNWTNVKTIDIVSQPGPNEKWGPGTLLVTPYRGDPYIVSPSGEFSCMFAPPTGTPDPPDVDDPPEQEPPPDLSLPFAQLRTDFEILRADYQQFKQVAFQSFDSLKKALWDSFCRSNVQAAEVYATAQGGWQGPPPGVQCLEIPAAWQSYPTPGNPQVLELPPIQGFPQAPAPQPFDPTGLQQELEQMQQYELQLNQDIAQLVQQIPVVIDNAIKLYDRDVEKPDLQKMRDECCTPKGPLTQEQKERICEEGRLKWGIMAECWLNENTPEVPPEAIRFNARLSGQDLATELRLALSDAPSGHFADSIRGYGAKIRALLTTGALPDITAPPEIATIDTSYVYEKAPGL